MNFLRWYHEAYWTAHGEVFDVGLTTREALQRLEDRVSPLASGCKGEDDNGNGSLMRIAPLVFYLQDKPAGERFEIIRQVSSVTHAHIRSVIACYYFLEFARHLCAGKDKLETYTILQAETPGHLAVVSIDAAETARFDRLLKGDIHKVGENSIRSSGYVVHTLEAAIWRLMTTSTYSDAVLKAVNLGHDTDTTAAVTGALAGLLYGYDTIPAHWIEKIARRGDIEDLAERLAGMVAGL